MLFPAVVLLTFGLAASLDRPHIVYILVDDMGWNDVGFHGSGQIPTPNIDALAFSGVMLNRFYVTPICTPSRSALMTGKHPIHTGMQHSVLNAAEPRGLPLTEKILPQYLRELGYNAHAVGKWHLGFYKKEYTPTHRGFESHLGFWTGHQDYNDHVAVETDWGFDMRRNMEPADDLFGKYSTDVFANEAARIIEHHNSSRPLFLYIAHAAVHSGNGYNPLPTPDSEAAKFSTIENYNRRRFAGMMSKLDQSVGTVVKALKKQNMLKDSIIVFSTDNGGPAAGFNANAASNWPLRGVKNTHWEGLYQLISYTEMNNYLLFVKCLGGVRGAGFIWSPRLVKPGRVGHQVMHIADWVPTLIAAAGGDTSNLTLDGIDMWKAISEDLESPRKTVLHNIDDIYGISSIMKEGWKLIQGMTYEGMWDHQYGPSGREWAYNVDAVIGSVAGQSIRSIGMQLRNDDIRRLLEEGQVKCQEKNSSLPVCIPLKKPCLFNVYEDPCENNNLIDVYPDKFHILLEEIIKLNQTVVPPANMPKDAKANPRFWNNRWATYGDPKPVKS